MAEAGYSGTPLQQKLGLKTGFRVACVGAPLPPGIEGVEVRTTLRGPLDAVLLFTTSAADLGRRAPAAMKALGDVGILWVAWPKKASKVSTDLTENVLRDVLLPTGWVDVKVCAIDATWSGLKFVKRVEHRRTV